MIAELILVYRAAKRLAAFKNARARGLSSEEARHEADQNFPMKAEDFEYEEYVRQTNRPFGRIPWISTLALALPIIAVIRIAEDTSDTWLIAGNGITQLGYVLLVAGIIAGKFGVLNLFRRSITLACAVACLGLGFILSNLNS